MQINKLFRHKVRDILIVLTLFGIWGIIPLLVTGGGQTLFAALFIMVHCFLSYLIGLQMRDIHDILWYKYKVSVFDDGNDSYWKPDWKRKYNWKGERITGHKQFSILGLKMDIPDFWFNALKLVKVIEIWLEWNIIFYLLNLTPFFNFYNIVGYIIFTIIAATITYYLHKWGFSGWMLK